MEVEEEVPKQEEQQKYAIDKNVGYCLGIDEAGRGPVLGNTTAAILMQIIFCNIKVLWPMLVRIAHFLRETISEKEDFKVIFLIV